MVQNKYHLEATYLIHLPLKEVNSLKSYYQKYIPNSSDLKWQYKKVLIEKLLDKYSVTRLICTQMVQNKHRLLAS